MPSRYHRRKVNTSILALIKSCVTRLHLDHARGSLDVHAAVFRSGAEDLVTPCRRRLIMARALKSFGAVVSLYCILGSGSPALAYVATSFYVVGHQDDWQLFMTSSAYDDVRTPNTKVVCIYTTAGDGGNGTGTLNRTIPYYIAREEGALRAVQFAATRGFGNQDTSAKTTVNNHTIMQSTYLNTTSYFFRLPGTFDGNGYPGTGY
jgi:hypothetical protein